MLRPVFVNQCFTASGMVNEDLLNDVGLLGNNKDVRDI